jgi:hypothetical protein
MRRSNEPWPLRIVVQGLSNLGDQAGEVRVDHKRIGPQVVVEFGFGKHA